MNTNNLFQRYLNISLKKMIGQISHDEFFPDNGKDNFDFKWS